MACPPPPPPIPILLLTGHLGAGKTTALNHLLGLPEIASRQPALIINEFGRLGVDGRLVRPGPWERFELNKGSLFCVCLKTDFLATLRTLDTRVHPGVVLVEATGVADPCDLEHLIDEPRLAGRFVLAAGLCLIDASTFLTVAAFLRTAQRQAMWADGLVINQIDRTTPDQLARLRMVLGGLNPTASVIETQQGRIPADFLATCRHRPRSGHPTQRPPEPIRSFTLKPAGIWPAVAFRQWIDDLHPHLLRLKGWVDFGEGPQFVEWAGDRLINERPPAPAAADSGLVVILWNLEEGECRKKIGRAGLPLTNLEI